MERKDCTPLPHVLGFLLMNLISAKSNLECNEQVPPARHPPRLPPAPGASSPSPSRPDDVVEPERRERLGLLPPTETLEATRAASAADLEASAAMLVARSSEESLNSQARLGKGELRELDGIVRRTG